MALTEEEIKNIGRETGKKTVVKAKCKERAAFVMDQIKDAREQELETIMLSLPSISLKKAQGEIISDVNSHIETVKEFYPDMPIKELLLREYEQIKNQAINAGMNGQVIIVSRAAEGYGSIQDKLLNMLLEDFKQCECDEQGISQGVPLLDRPMPQTYADWVKLGDDIKASYSQINNMGGIATVDYNLNTISHEGSVPPVETNEAIANAKRWLLLAAGRLR